MDDETRAQIERSVDELAESIATEKSYKLREFLRGWCMASGLPLLSTTIGSGEEAKVSLELLAAISSCINSGVAESLMARARNEAVKRFASMASDRLSSDRLAAK